MNKITVRGFTIVELIVVIAVIGIIASISIVSYTTVQNKARAASLVTAIQTVEHALKRTASKQNTEIWFNDQTFTGVNNPNLISVVASPNAAYPAAVTLASQLPQGVPVVSGVDTTLWTYDHDTGSDSIRDPALCDFGWTGVILGLNGVTAAIAQEVDKQIDDGITNCGRVRFTGATLLYQLGFDQQIK